MGVAPVERKTDKYQSMTQLEKETTEGVDWRKDTKTQGIKYSLWLHMVEVLNKVQQN